MKLRSPIILLLCTVLMVLQCAFISLPAFAAGTNVPNITNYGVYSYDPNSNDITTTVALPTVTEVTTGNTGTIYINPPWTTLKNVPCVFSSNVGIGLKFAVNVIADYINGTQNLIWPSNQACFHMNDSSNNPVDINVVRAGTVYDGTNGNRQYIFLVPKAPLKSGCTYKIKVDGTLTSAGGKSTNIQQEVDFTTVSIWPAGSSLTYSSLTQTGLTLNWTAAKNDAGVTGYKVYQGTTLLDSVSAGTSSYSVTGLVPNTAYTFKVEACDASGSCSSDGPTANVTTLTDSQAPAWPAGSALRASIVSQTGLTLSWPAATDNVAVTGYNIYQGETLIKSVSAATGSYYVSGLTAGTGYTFTVQAVDASGNLSTGGPSITVTTATANSNGSSVSLTLTPSIAAPGASVTAQGTASPSAWVSLKVNDSEGNLTVFDGTKADNNGNYSLTFIVPSVSDGIFSVVAGYGYDVANMPLTVDSAAPMDSQAPAWPNGSALTAGDVTATGLTLSWSAATDNTGVTGYKIYRGGTLLNSTPVSGNTYTVTGLSSATQYTFTVQSGDDAGNWSADGPSVTVTTSQSGNNGSADSQAPVWPDGSALTAGDVTTTGLTLSWSAATDDSGVTGYRIYQGETLLNSTPVSGSTYTVTGLSSDTRYTFTVQAGDAAGNWSNDGPNATVTTGHQSNGGSTDSQVPTWPTGAVVTVSRNQTEASLTWPKAMDNVGVTGYRIKRDGKVINNVDGGAATYTDTGLERGVNTYVWSIEAFDAAGNYSKAITGQAATGQNPLSFVAANSSLTTVNGDNSTNDGPIDGSTTVPVKPTIRLYFDRGVTTDAVWSNNQRCFTMQDSEGADVNKEVFRLGSATINDNLHYIFIKPTSNLTAGKTYKIIISKNLTANNGHTLGENNGDTDEAVTFTVEGSAGSNTPSGSGTSVTTNGPTFTTGSASVDPAVGATVSLGDLAKVVIPANALKETGSVTVDVKEVISPPEIPAGFKVAGAVYEFSVGGKNTYSFAQKIALTFEFDASQIGPDEVPAVYYYDESQAKWVNIGGTVSGSTITVEVDHFTKYTVFAAQKPATFNDIEGHWAQNNIEKLVALGDVSGYPDGSFKPDDTISRAEFATMLVKTFKLTPKSGKVFADTAGHWAGDYIATAAANGIVSGYDDNSFGPDDLITREQMAAMIVKAAGFTMVSEETSFADNSDISGWAKGAVATAVKYGLMNGYPDNTFQPLGSATRAEAVTVIVNAL